jgi:hypothetical protein
MEKGRLILTNRGGCGRVAKANTQTQKLTTCSLACNGVGMSGKVVYVAFFTPFDYFFTFFAFQGNKRSLLILQEGKLIWYV